HVGVLDARCEHADPHLARAGRRQRSVHHLELLGIAETPDADDPVARLARGRDAHSSADYLAGAVVTRFDRRRSRRTRLTWASRPAPGVARPVNCPNSPFAASRPIAWRSPR